MNFTQVRVQARFQAPGTSQPRLLCLRPTEFTLSSAAFTLRTDIAPIVHGVTVALALGPSKKVIAPRSSESPNAFPLIWISKRLGRVSSHPDWYETACPP